MPVPPNSIRPSIVLTNAMTNEDDLTVKIKNIIDLNL
jgi:DNA-directed RNA polymerase beta' subunit